MRCWIAALELKLPCGERLIQSPHRAFGCFSLLILNDRAAPSYQLLDLSLAGLPLDRLFLIADLLSFEVGVLVLSFLGNYVPLLIYPIQHLIRLPHRRARLETPPPAEGPWASAIRHPTAT